MSKINPNTMREQVYEKFHLQEERKIVPTIEDWSPSLDENGSCLSHWINGEYIEYGPETKRYVEAKLGIWVTKDLSATWYISFWGGDDIGMGKIFNTYEEAEAQFDLLTETGPISFDDLEALEFKHGGI
ncbi:MAG: hypothetical protein WC390_10400 [Sulfurimonas sp.]|jgi:hypothetical protein